MSSGIPTPVSITEKETTASARDSASLANCRPSASSTRSATLPASVNLNAFESRFFRICCRRCSSVSSVGGTFAPCTSISNFSSLSSATGRNERSTKSRTSDSFTSVTWTSIRPASTFERSRMSLIRSSRSEPAL